MNHLVIKLLLFLYCMFTLLFRPADAAFIMVLLTAVILSCTVYFRESSYFRFAAVSLYALASFFFLPFVFFFPLLFYDIFQYRLFLPMGLAAISFLIHTGEMNMALSGFLLLGIAVARLFYYLVSTHAVLDQKYCKTRDDSTELELLLKQKNKDLLEKQDYEIYTATLLERNRIAREIHDNVGHMLSRSILMLGALQTTCKDDTSSTSLTLLEETLSGAMNSIRKSVHNLHDEPLDLHGATLSLVKTFSFCPISLDYDMSLFVPREIKYSFLTITKEAISNIITHSNATFVQLLMREHPGLYQLVIEDNGTTAQITKRPGIGLHNMEERVEALHGNIQISQDKGFRIFITIPKHNSLESEER